MTTNLPPQESASAASSPRTPQQRSQGGFSGLLLFVVLLALMLPAVAQAQFNYTTANGTITITKYTGPDGDVIIPGKINGLPVVGIGRLAFDNRHALTSITIPDTVTSIGEGAFLACVSLTSITLPERLTTLGFSALAVCTSLTAITIPDHVKIIAGATFDGCSNLVSVTLPNSVNSIGGAAFRHCSSLTVIDIPDRVTSIGYDAFQGCTSLSAIRVNSGNSAYSSVDGILFDKKQATLFQFPGGKGGSYRVPNNVTKIGYGAFLECPFLYSITVDPMNSVYGGMDGVLYNKSQTTLIQCPAGKSGNYTIPNSATTILSGAFFRCANLSSVTIGNGIASIRDGGFYDCAGLTNVAIPNKVTSIGRGAFSGCIRLAGLTIPDGVTRIEETTFFGCTNLTSITLPNKVTTVGPAAFARCTSLASVTLPNGITNIGFEAFWDCASLASIALPNRLTSISSGSFRGCTSLTNVTIPDGVISIGDGAFSDCISLVNVTIPSRVAKIGTYAFESCYNLAAIYFRGNAPSIGFWPFNQAYNAILYYLPGTRGWGPTFGGLTTARWYPANCQLLVHASGQGTLSPNYSNATLNIGWNYSMTAAGVKGHVFSRWVISTNWSEGESVTTPKLTFMMQSNLTVEAVFVDVVRPTVTISSPVTGQRISNALATVRGRASDNGQLAQVLCQVNNSDWVPALGTSNWTASLPLIVGTNRVRVVAEDSAGRFSATNTVTFLHVAASQFSLLTNGLGRVARNFTGNTLEVDRSYTLTALPATGQLFSNWVGTITATNNPLKFVMQSNMVLQANFVPNPYLALKGPYAGLFRPPLRETVSGTNAGSLALSLTENGAFSGSLRLAGTTLAFTGRFDVGRQSTVKVSRPGKAPLWLNLGFDSQTVTGQVSTGGWAADLLALRRATASSNALAGRYSMLVMGHNHASDAPPGDSPLAVTVTAPSSMTVSGTMADGSAVTLATGHSVDGYWPFYAPLDGGRGLVIGWMSCATNAGPQEVLWVKPPDSVARFYPAGFREKRLVAVKRYQPPALKQSAVSWSSTRAGNLIIGGGNLTEPLYAEVLVTNNLTKSLSGSLSNLSLVITHSNGRFGGSFLHPVTRKTTPLKGILVQGLPFASPAEQVTVGGGWFLGTNQGGYLWLEPKP